jgi:transposase
MDQIIARCAGLDEDDFTLLLVNARQVKAVPRRKTDVRYSEWLAQLLECGLLRASFVPPPPIRDLRDLTRYRRKQVDERGRPTSAPRSSGCGRETVHPMTGQAGSSPNTRR